MSWPISLQKMQKTAINIQKSPGRSLRSFKYPKVNIEFSGPLDKDIQLSENSNVTVSCSGCTGPHLECCSVSHWHLKL